MEVAHSSFSWNTHSLSLSLSPAPPAHLHHWNTKHTGPTLSSLSVSGRTVAMASTKPAPGENFSNISARVHLPELLNLEHFFFPHIKHIECISSSNFNILVFPIPDRYLYISTPMDHSFPTQTLHSRGFGLFPASKTHAGCFRTNYD